MKISSKLRLVSSVNILLTLLICVLAIIVYGSLNKSINVTTSNTIQIIKTLDELRFNGLRIVSSTVEYILLTGTRNKSTSLQEQKFAEIALVEEGIKNSNESLRRYLGLISKNSPSDSLHYSRISFTLNHLILASSEIIHTKGSSASDSLLILKKEIFEEDEMNFLTAVDGALLKKDTELKSKQTEIASALRLNMIVIIISALFVVAVISLISFLFRRSVSGPIGNLRDAALKIKDGVYEPVEGIKSRDEVGDLANSFNTMTEKLRDSFDNLNKEISEKIRAEEAVKISERKFRALIEHSSEGIVLLDDKGAFIYASPVSEKILGYSPEEILNKPVFNFIHPEENEMAQNQLEQILQMPGAFFPIILKFKHKNGSYIWVEATSTNMLNQPYLNAIIVNFHDITDNKEAEEMLKVSELNYRNIVEGTRAILFSTDASGRFTYLNDAACTLLEKTQEELIGTHYLRFVHPENRSVTHSALRKQLIDPTPNKSLDVRIISSSGKEGWLNLLVNPVFENAKVVGLSSVALDITDRKKVDEALRISEKKYRELADFLPQPVFEYDLNGRFTFANKTSLQLTGYSEEDLNNDLTVFDLIDPQQHDKILEMIEKRIKKIPAGRTEYTIIRKDGSSFPVEAFASVIESNGKIVGLRGMIIDITERKKTEAILTRNAARLKVLNNIAGEITGSLDIDVIMDRTVNLVHENFKYNHVAILTYNGEDNYVVLKAIAGAFENLFEKGVEIYLEKGMIIWAAMTGQIAAANDVSADPHYVNVYPDMINTRSELCIPLKIGERVYGILDLQTPELGAFSSEDIEALSTLADQIAMAIKNSLLYREAQDELAGRKKAEEELKEMIVSKDKLFSIIAHDLKSPFLGLLGFSEYLTDELNNLSRAEVKEYLGKNHVTVKRLYKLIENLLEWARLQTGRATIALKNISLSSSVEFVFNLLAENAEKKEVELKNESGQFTIVRADERMLQSILENLISNGIKFSLPGGSIIVSSEEDDNKVAITVEDNGIGMSEEIISKLFRSDSAYSAEGTAGEKGTGLGLLICKDMVVKLSGNIQVTSEEGKGSKFIFTLPKATGKDDV